MDRCGERRPRFRGEPSTSVGRSHRVRSRGQRQRPSPGPLRLRSAGSDLESPPATAFEPGQVAGTGRRRWDRGRRPPDSLEAFGSRAGVHEAFGLRGPGWPGGPGHGQADRPRDGRARATVRFGGAASGPDLLPRSPESRRDEANGASFGWSPGAESRTGRETGPEPAAGKTPRALGRVGAHRSRGSVRSRGAWGRRRGRELRLTCRVG